jgi:hypothetical protein
MPSHILLGFSNSSMPSWSICDQHRICQACMHTYSSPDLLWRDFRWDRWEYSAMPEFVVPIPNQQTIPNLLRLKHNEDCWGPPYLWVHDCIDLVWFGRIYSMSNRLINRFLKFIKLIWNLLVWNAGRFIVPNNLQLSRAALLEPSGPSDPRSQERLRQAAFQADIIGYKALEILGIFGAPNGAIFSGDFWGKLWPLWLWYDQPWAWAINRCGKWVAMVNHANHAFFTCLFLSVNCSSSAAAHGRLQRRLHGQSWRPVDPVTRAHPGHDHGTKLEH